MLRQKWNPTKIFTHFFVLCLVAMQVSCSRNDLQNRLVGKWPTGTGDTLVFTKEKIGVPGEVWSAYSLSADSLLELKPDSGWGLSYRIELLTDDSLVLVNRLFGVHRITYVRE